jgi:hypothetical protein
LKNIDIEKLKLPQNYINMAGAEKITTRIPVRKPRRQEFVRINPDENFQLTTGIVELKDDQEVYLVDPSILGELTGEWIPVRLVLAISRQGVLMLWPLKLPTDEGKINPWHASALDAAELAENFWVRIAANRALGAYEVFKAVGELPDPEWPNMSFSEIIEIAFKDQYIAGPDHVVVQRLRGQV